MRFRLFGIQHFARRGLLYSIGLSLVILAVGGAGFWIVDPNVASFHEGLWLAFTTAATVGYGDIVPSTGFSRVFAVLVVLLGLGVLSLVTASIAAVFVQTEERQIERDLLHAIHKVHNQLGRLEADMMRLEERLDSTLARQDAKAPP